MEPADTKYLATELMKIHGLDDWRFDFDRAKKRFGQCRYGDKTITLSLFVSMDNDLEEVKDCILHEIAHALTQGERLGHGPEWRRKCVEIGANPERCFDSVSVKTEKGKVRGVCPNCEHETFRLRLPKRFDQACKWCCDQWNNGKYSAEYQLIWIDER